MAYYTLDCVEARERPIDPRDAEIARLTEENRALHGFIANWERFAGERFINNALAGASKADPQYSLSSSYCAIAKYRHREEASR